jgi:hypothetical protein
MNRVTKRIVQALDLESIIDKAVASKVKDIRKSISSESKPYKTAGTLSPLIGAEYTILDIDKPCNFWGFIDLSDLRAGDACKVEVKFKSLDDKYKSYISKDYMAPLPTPILDFDPKNVLGVKITVKQPSGFPERTVIYCFDWSPL